jgi:hypothetical protein
MAIEGKFDEIVDRFVARSAYGIKEIITKRSANTSDLTAISLA